MKYHFYSSVSLSILVGTASKERGPKTDREMMKFPSGQSTLVLSPSMRGGGPCFFCSLPLIPVPLLFLWFILLARTKTALPTNAAAAFQGQASGCWAKETTGEEHGSREDRKDRGGEEGMQFHPLWRSSAAPSFHYPTSTRPYSETHLMNTPALIQPHNGALHCHWACSQWRTSLQLNPRDNELG